MRTAVVLLCLGGSAYAVPVLVANRAAQNETETVNWGQFGAAGTVVPSGSSALGSLGTLVNLQNNAATSFQISQIGNGWGSGLPPGVPLLFNGDGEPTSFVFSAPVAGVGFNFENNFLGNYTATMAAFDLANVLLGTYQISGNSGNGSIEYFGILDSLNSISRITMTTNNGNGFAIDTMSLSVLAAPSGAPEMDGSAATMPLLFLAGVLLTLSGRRRLVTTI